MPRHPLPILWTPGCSLLHQEFFKNSMHHHPFFLLPPGCHSDTICTLANHQLSVTQFPSPPTSLMHKQSEPPVSAFLYAAEETNSLICFGQRCGITVPRTHFQYIYIYILCTAACLFQEQSLMYIAKSGAPVSFDKKPVPSLDLSLSTSHSYLVFYTPKTIKVHI